VKIVTRHKHIKISNSGAEQYPQKRLIPVVAASFVLFLLRPPALHLKVEAEALVKGRHSRAMLKLAAD
jgi:hypothetical protein